METLAVGSVAKPSQTESDKQRFGLAYGLAIGLGVCAAIAVVGVWYWRTQKTAAGVPSSKAAAGEETSSAAAPVVA